MQNSGASAGCDQLSAAIFRHLCQVVLDITVQAAIAQMVEVTDQQPRQTLAESSLWPAVVVQADQVLGLLTEQAVMRQMVQGRSLSNLIVAEAMQSISPFNSLLVNESTTVTG